MLYPKEDKENRILLYAVSVTPGASTLPGRPGPLGPFFGVQTPHSTPLGRSVPPDHPTTLQGTRHTPFPPAISPDPALLSPLAVPELRLPAGSRQQLHLRQQNHTRSGVSRDTSSWADGDGGGGLGPQGPSLIPPPNPLSPKRTDPDHRRCVPGPHLAPDRGPPVPKVSRVGLDAGMGLGGERV